MSNSQKYFLIILTLIAVATLLVGCDLPGLQAAPTPTAEPLEDIQPVISATGMVVPAQWTMLSMATEGVIEEIMVKEGQVVSKGETLLRLKGSKQLKAAVSAAQLDLVSAEQALDTLHDEAEKRRSDAQLAVAETEKAYKQAKDHRASKEFTHGDQEDIDSAYANYVLAEQAVKDAQKDFDEQAAWRTEDDLVRANLLSVLAAARAARDETLRHYNYVKSLPDDYDVAQSEGELVVAKAALEDALRKWEKVKDAGVDPNDLKLAETALANARAQLESDQAALLDRELAAPFDGTVSRLDVHASEWVQAGQSVMIVADLQNLLVETTDLNEIDAAQVEVGNTVNVTFDALPDVAVKGKVSFIAPKSEGTGVNYKVQVKMQEVPQKLRWGMTAFVDILVVKE